MQPTDEALVSRIRDGDQDAAGTLFDRLWPSSWRAAYAIIGSRAIAEDVAQDALVKAFGSLERFDGRRPFGVWLHRIVVNRAIDELRRQRRHVGLGEAAGQSYELETRINDPALTNAIAALSPDRRAVIVLRYGLDYTPAEIADVLDVAVGTVHSRLARALADLRTALEVPDVH